MFTLYTFGDSILDSGAYNPLALTPAALIVRNNDRLFPEFRGRDLASRGPARLIHRLARDWGSGVRTFARTLHDFLAALPVRPVFLGKVYDPTFGDDARNFL